MWIKERGLRLTEGLLRAENGIYVLLEVGWRYFEVIADRRVRKFHS